MTNGDCLRAMTNEELDKLLREKFNACCRRDEWDACIYDCHRCWSEWLKEEVQEDE